MKPITVYYISQLLCTIMLFGLSVTYYQVYSVVGIALLVSALFEALKLWTAYDGDETPAEYDNAEVVKRILMIKGWFMINVAIVYTVMFIHPETAFMGLGIIVGLQYMSDVNIEFYKT